MYTVGTRVRKDRLNKKGETRILIVLFQGKKNNEWSSGISIKPKDWDFKRNKIRSSDPSYLVKNSILNKKIAEYEDLISKALAINPDSNLRDIVKANKVVSKNIKLTDYLRNYIDHGGDGLQSSTLTYYETTYKRILEYNPNILLSEVDSKFLIGFEKWLRDDHGNKQNTIWNRLKVIRKICHRARRESLIETNPFEFFKLKTEDTERDYLTIQEIKSLNNLENLTELQELVKDTYIFCVFSGGIRFSDVAVLNWNHLSMKDGNLRLRLKMAKTDKYVDFIVPKIGREILNKYKGLSKRFCFPIIPNIPDVLETRLWISRKNAVFNKTLKTLAKKAEINKHLTFHTSRHTFATLLLSTGVQTEVVKEILGHKDLKTTQIYTKILDVKKDDAINTLDSLI